MRVEVAVLGSRPNKPTVSVNVRQHSTSTNHSRAQELCESRGGRPGLPIPNSLYGLCRRKATSKKKCVCSELRSCVKVVVAVLAPRP